MAEDNGLDMPYPLMEFDLIVIDGEEGILSDENGVPISDDFITVVVNEQPTQPDEEDEESHIEFGGLTGGLLSGSVAIERSSDDPWYHPFTFSQFIAVAIGSGCVIIFSTLIMMMCFQRMKQRWLPRVVIPDMMPTE